MFGKDFFGRMKSSPLASCTIENATGAVATVFFERFVLVSAIGIAPVVVQEWGYMHVFTGKWGGGGTGRSGG